MRILKSAFNMEYLSKIIESLLKIQYKQLKTV